MVWLTSLLACGTPVEEPAVVAPPGAVTVIYTSRGEGEIEPCG